MDISTARTAIELPPVIIGTTGLGNLFVALDDNVKLAIIKECFQQGSGNVVFDSAGKYGAGMSLEVLGNCLRQLQIKPNEVIISNKLGWVRSELKTAEPTFEPGVWKALQYDAVQKISYDGILESFEQGNNLLGGYIPQMVSVHDPDEYLAKATSPEEEKKLYNDILEAYKALFELKSKGIVKAVGVGAKDWKSIQRICNDVELDWVMIANSLTIMSHPDELIQFMHELKQKGVQIINSALFNGGFLMGGDFFNYKKVSRDNGQEKHLFQWRDRFYTICREYKVKPAEAGVQFGLKAPGVVSIALSTTHPDRVKENFAITKARVPEDFWEQLKAEGLIARSYHYIP